MATNYVEFAEHIIGNCPLLDDSKIDEYIRKSRLDEVYSYLYRIALYAVTEIKSKEYDERSDDDYVDAVQHCATCMQQVLTTWLASSRRVKLSTYAQRAFRQQANRYLAVEERGGMASLRNRNTDAIPPIGSLDELVPDTQEDEEEESTWNDYVTYPSEIPIGLDNPVHELIRQETVENAVNSVPTSRTGLDRAQGQRLRREVGTLRINKT